MVRQRLPVLLIVLAVFVLGVTVSAPGASASSGPVFTVMNTSETPPDGVWFRNSAHTDDTDRVTGHGVYAGEQVQLDCYEWGEAVGPYGNALWYQATNLTRPTVNGAPNAGRLNAHYVDDGLAANQVDPGVPPCGSAPPATPPPPPPALGRTVVFYSGIGTAGAGDARAAGADRVLTEQPRDWRKPWETFDGVWPSGQLCVPSAAAVNFGGLDVNRLAGWSLGRLGPLYALKYLRDHNDLERARRINYVVLYDPGNPATLLGGCDTDPRVQASATLAWWLGLDGTDNRLVVLSAGGSAGTITDRHRSIQQAYFPDLKAQGLYRKVLVCNYPQLDHEQVYKDYAWLMTLERRLSTDEGFTSCPPLWNGEQVWGWNPHP